MTVDTETIRTPAAPPAWAGTVAGIALSAALWREGDALTRSRSDSGAQRPSPPARQR